MIIDFNKPLKKIRARLRNANKVIELNYRNTLSQLDDIVILDKWNYKCICGESFTVLDSCGTGTTWSLYKCKKCSQKYAIGYILPKEVLKDTDIICYQEDNNDIKLMLAENKESKVKPMPHSVGYQLSFFNKE